MDIYLTIPGFFHLTSSPRGKYLKTALLHRTNKQANKQYAYLPSVTKINSKDIKSYNIRYMVGSY